MNVRCNHSAAGPFIHFAEEENKLSLSSKNVTHGFRIVSVGGSLDSKENVFKAIAGAMGFPDYFGMNWDAFDECLNDLSWLPSSRFVIVLKNGVDLLRLPANDLKTFFKKCLKMLWTIGKRKNLHCILLLLAQMHYFSD